MDATVKSLNLLDVRHATGDQPPTDPAGIGQRLQRIADLHSEFTSWHQDQAKGLTGFGATATELGEHREAKS